MTAATRVRLLTHFDAEGIAGLCDVLTDCVEGGASVSFMWPMTRDKARTFWEGVAASARRGERLVYVAEDDAGIVGTVQVVWAQPENQPHRGDIAKMLVHRRGRKRGIGAALLKAAEAGAREAGRTVLVLDTASPDAERLYAREGWQACGVVPAYALWPDGRPCPTTFFYKDLGA